MDIYGVPYPLVKDPRGYFHTQSGIDQIKSDLLILLLTNPGERVMLSDYGTPLRKLIFEQNDATLQLQAKQMVIKSIETWEPRIVVEAIDVTGADMNTLNPQDTQEDLDYILTIKISFSDPYNLNNIETLVLQVPLASSPTSSVTQPLTQARNQGATIT